MDTKHSNCEDGCENSEKVGHLVTPPANTTARENPSGCGLYETITISVAPTTGGTFDVTVQKDISVESLKKLIAKKLKVAKERILLLHKERQLRDGTLVENNILDGSTLTLLPSVETGLLSQRPEQTVMQALESLNDSQVNDFLSGKAPLNLTMRLGDHMMLIQLQLSSVTPSTSRKTSSHRSSSSSNSSSSHVPNSPPPPPPTPIPSTSTAEDSLPSQLPPAHSQSIATNPENANLTTPPAADLSSLPNLSLINSRLDSLLNKNLNVLKRKLSQETESSAGKKVKPETEKDCQTNENEPIAGTSDSPSASTSNLTSTKKSPVKCSDTLKDSVINSTEKQQQPLSKREILSQIMESVRKISQNAQEMSHVMNEGCNSGSDNKECDEPQPETEKPTQPSHDSRRCVCKSKEAKPATCQPNEPDEMPASPTFTALDTKALAEASRNLTQTLKQLSSEVLTCRPDPSDDSAIPGSSTSRRRLMTPGAIIETMQHHGKGVFSGTFSGTLNPALQDRFGRPKRDISTIIHILNDLLCATPHYRHRQSNSSNSSSSTPSTSSSNLSSPTSTQPQPDSSNSPPSTSNTNKLQGDEHSDPSQLPQDQQDITVVENAATRGKLERLRMVMEQNRARRRARREAKTGRLAAGAAVAAAAVALASSTAAATAAPWIRTGSEQATNPTDMETSEEIDPSTDILEISPPEPVLA